jgi:hypothetical protein
MVTAGKRQVDHSETSIDDAWKQMKKLGCVVVSFPSLSVSTLGAHPPESRSAVIEKLAV